MTEREDRLLREYFDAVPEPLATNEMRRRWAAGGRVRAPWRLVSAGVAATFVALCAVALLTVVSRRAEVTAGLVPWLAAAAPASDSAIPITRPGIARCSTAQLGLAVTGHPYVGTGPVNTSFWPVAISNVSGSACWLPRELGVRFTLPDARVFTYLHTTIAGEDISYLDPGQGANPPIMQGEIGVSGCGLPDQTRVGISTGDGTWDDIIPGPASGTGVACRDQRSTQALVSIFRLGGPFSVPYPRLTIEEVPASFRRGQRVRFAVKVSNDWAGHSLPGRVIPTLTFSPCPTYSEELEGSVGAFERHMLNCAGASPLRSGAAESFEMFINVPRDATLGPATLAWRLELGPGQSTRMSVPVEVAP